MVASMLYSLMLSFRLHLPPEQRAKVRGLLGTGGPDIRVHSGLHPVPISGRPGGYHGTFHEDRRLKSGHLREHIPRRLRRKGESQLVRFVLAQYVVEKASSDEGCGSSWSVLLA